MLAQARATFATAIASGDPEAVFRVGFFLVGGAHTSDEMRGLAIALAGCDLGYDCSFDNAAMFGYCVAAGSYPAGEDFSDMVTKAVGLAGYSKAYAMAEQLTQAIAAGDLATIRGFILLTR